MQMQSGLIALDYRRFSKLQQQSAQGRREEGFPVPRLQSSDLALLFRLSFFLSLLFVVLS